MSRLSLRQKLGLELSRKIRHNNYQLHPLRSLFWECTLRCNMHCRHCGSDCKVQADVPDMPVDDFLKVIDSLTPHVDPHTTFIIMTGGEALLRPDIEYVGAQLNRRGYPWGMVSNGYLLDEKRLSSLLAAGMHSMSISIDGFEEQHNWIRGNVDSFSRACRAISLLAATKGFLWDVVTCVNPQNYPDLSQFKEFLISLGVRRWRIFSIFPMGRAANDPQLQLTPAQLRGILDFVKESRKTDSRIHVSYACEGFLGEYEAQVRDHFFYCRAGVEVASILCDGSISGCTSMRSNMYQGNIYHDDFWDVWQNRFGKYRNREWTRKGSCRDCKMWRYCEGSGLHLYDDDANLLTCHYHKVYSVD